MKRYAVYFVPYANAGLWDYGCRAVGYDSVHGCDVPFHAHPFYQRADIADLTADPRRYGFHGTLKAPFALAEGRTVAELEAAVAQFAATRAPFTCRALQPAAIGRFLALVPVEPLPMLQDLAADCTRVFDSFRGPLPAADRERRLNQPLSPRQIGYLDQWGYPYVFEELRFHMTLTGRLADDVKGVALAALQELYSRHSGPVTFDAITICEQNARDTRFLVRRQFMLRG